MRGQHSCFHTWNTTGGGRIRGDPPHSSLIGEIHLSVFVSIGFAFLTRMSEFIENKRANGSTLVSFIWK